MDNKSLLYPLVSGQNVACLSGTGKSHLAQALAHCAIRQEIDVLCMLQSKLFSELQAAKAFGRYDKKFSELAKVPLLIIDDFGLRPMRSP